MINTLNTLNDGYLNTLNGGYFCTGCGQYVFSPHLCTGYYKQSYPTPNEKNWKFCPHCGEKLE